MPTCQGRYAPPEAVALLLPPARTILKYALFYTEIGSLQKILNMAAVSLNLFLPSGYDLSKTGIRLSIVSVNVPRHEFYCALDGVLSVAPRLVLIAVVELLAEPADVLGE